MADPGQRLDKVFEDVIKGVKRTVFWTCHESPVDLELEFTNVRIRRGKLWIAQGKTLFGLKLATQIVAEEKPKRRPLVETRDAIGLRKSSATLVGAVISGPAPTNAWFEVGEKPANLDKVADSEREISTEACGETIQFTLGKLKSKQVYYFRIAASDPDGPTESGATVRFRTE